MSGVSFSVDDASHGIAGASSDLLDPFLEVQADAHLAVMALPRSPASVEGEVTHVSLAHSIKKTCAAPKKRKIIPSQSAEIIEVGPLELLNTNAHMVQNVIIEKRLERY